MNERLTNERMTTEPDTQRLRHLERRLDRLRDELASRAVATAYAACFAVLAGIIVVLSFFPILGKDVVDDGYGSAQTYTFGSIWEMASQGQETNPAGLGAFLMVSLVVMLVLAVFRRSPGAGGLDGAIAVVAALLVVMLLTRPGTGEADPPLTKAGQAGVAIAILTMVLATAHLTYATAGRRREAKPTDERARR